MIRKARDLGLLRLLLLLLLFFAAVWGFGKRLASTEVPRLYGAEIEAVSPQAAPQHTVSVHFTGISLFRVNALYVNGKQIRVRYRENIGYSDCRLSVDEGVFRPGETVRVSVGKRYPLSLGVIYRSNTIEFTPQAAPPGGAQPGE